MFKIIRNYARFSNSCNNLWLHQISANNLRCPYYSKNILDSSFIRKHRGQVFFFFLRNLFSSLKRVLHYWNFNLHDKRVVSGAIYWIAATIVALSFSRHIFLWLVGAKLKSHCKIHFYTICDNVRTSRGKLVETSCELQSNQT